MDIIGYKFDALTGGSATALDGEDGAGLNDGDFAFVMTTAGILYVYVLDADSAVAESSPTVISPDNNAGDKRWILKNAYSAANVPTGGTAGQALVKLSGTDFDMVWATLSALTSLYPSASPSADHSVSGIIATMQVGENVVFGDQLYMKSDGKLWKSDKDSADTMPIIAMAAATILANDSGQVLRLGFARDDSWDWILGGSAGLIYASTAGALTQTRPTSGKVQVVAIATHADRLFFFPQAMEPDAVVIPGTIGISIDGGGSAIETGVKGYVTVPYDCTITGWYLTGSPSGSIVIDVWKAAGTIPTVAGTITGTEKPTLSSAQVASDTDLTTWTTAVSAGDIIGFNVDSCSLVEQATLAISVTK